MVGTDSNSESNTQLNRKYEMLNAAVFVIINILISVSRISFDSPTGADVSTHSRITSYSGGASPAAPSRSRSIVGTLEYMAPEVLILFGKRKLHKDGYTGAIDFWCLGIMIYKLLTNEEPFTTNYSCEVLQSILPTHLSKYSNYHEAFDDLFGIVNYDVRDGVLTEHARSLLRGLLEFKADARLGYNAEDLQIGFNELMNHPFFGSIDWSLLEAKQLPPPYVPEEEVLDIIRHDRYPAKSLTEMLRDANKAHWCEEFNPPSSPAPNRVRMRIPVEDQIFFQQWYYVKPVAEETV